MTSDRNERRLAARLRRKERRRITYHIVVSGRDDEAALETVAEWGRDSLTELFAQEGWDVHETEPPIISMRASPETA